MGKLRPGSYTDQKAKTKDPPEFLFIQNAKIRYGWGLIMLKILKYGTVGVLCC